MQVNCKFPNFWFQVSGGFVAAIALGNGALPANAIALNGVLGSWSNPTGGDSSTIEYLNVGDESQVRWGQPFNSDKSGLGFIGTGATAIEVGESFLIGKLRHFNHLVFNGTAANAVDLTVNLAFSEPALTSAFNFTLHIQETLNVSPCYYPGITICPDKISFPNTIASNTIAFDNTDYTLEFLGFSPIPNGTPVNEMISEELGEDNTFFYLFGRLIADDSAPASQPIPEPGTLLGLSALGIYLWKNRH